PSRTLLHVGHHEPRIVFGFRTLRPQHLGFIHDATFPRPGLARAVVTLGVNMLGLLRALRSTTGPLHGRLRFSLQQRIGAHHIIHTFWRPSRFAIVGIRSLDRLFVL